MIHPFAPVRRALLCGLLLIAAPAAVSAAQEAGLAQWPNFRGPARDNISPEKTPPAVWPAEGPKVLWKLDIGEGYSGVAVIGSRVYTMGNKDEKDTVYCLDAEKGTEIWNQSYDCPKGGGGYSGPRATPTVDDGVVYTFSNTGILNAYDADKGTVKWTKNIAKEVGAKKIQWGYAGSVLVDGDNLILNLNAQGVAVKKTDGSVVWKSAAEACGYASPIPFTHQNRKCALIFSAKELVAIDRGTGAKLWSYPWETKYDVNAADPIIVGTQIFISSNYGKGGTLIDFASGQPVKVWENKVMKNHFNACVLINGCLYGNSEGKLTCMDWKTGASRWVGKDDVERGGLTAVGDTLIVLSGRGKLMLVDADPKQYSVTAKADVLGKDCWTNPVFVGGKIYCRSHDGTLVCVAGK